jgi:hypothetical protein
MEAATGGPPAGRGGIRVRVENDVRAAEVDGWLSNLLDRTELKEARITTRRHGTTGPYLQVQVRSELAAEWAPGDDTSRLCQILKLDTEGNDGDLDREILLAMMLSPVPFEFPSHDELMSAVRIRRFICQAARRTAIAFDTSAAERPPDYWRYDEDRGFVLLPGKSLIAAMEKATNSGVPDTLYTFSCRRATEYLVLLGHVREAMTCNPKLWGQLHRQAETRAVKGSEFDGVFVRTIGSAAEPFPVRYFVPGDRHWFRNTDPVSSNVTGYEGSWTIHLGGGLFADFWRRDRVFTLETKLACVYHWRNAVCRDSHGDLQIDETRVDELIEESVRPSGDLDRILQETLRLQSPLGIEGGGCIEPHREHPCLVRPETTDLVLPDVY